MATRGLQLQQQRPLRTPRGVCPKSLPRDPFREPPRIAAKLNPDKRPCSCARSIRGGARTQRKVREPQVESTKAPIPTPTKVFKWLPPDRDVRDNIFPPVRRVASGRLARSLKKKGCLGPHDVCVSRWLLFFRRLHGGLALFTVYCGKLWGICFMCVVWRRQKNLFVNFFLTPQFLGSLSRCRCLFRTRGSDFEVFLLFTRRFVCVAGGLVFGASAGLHRALVCRSRLCLAFQAVQMSIDSLISRLRVRLMTAAASCLAL